MRRWVALAGILAFLGASGAFGSYVLRMQDASTPSPAQRAALERLVAELPRSSRTLRQRVEQVAVVDDPAWGVPRVLLTYQVVSGLSGEVTTDLAVRLEGSGDGWRPVSGTAAVRHREKPIVDRFNLVPGEGHLAAIARELVEPQGPGAR